MIRKFRNRRELPGEILDDDRSWQGDHDPYLATLAHEGHLGKAPAPQRGPRLHGPADDGDPYPAELARRRRNDPA